MEVKALDHGAPFPPADEYYESAWEALNERFGRPEIMIAGHHNALMNLQLPQHRSGPDFVDELYSFKNALTTHTLALTALGQDLSKPQEILMPRIVSRLPQFLREEFGRRSTKDNQHSLSHLFYFLKKEIEVAERATSLDDVQVTPCIPTRPKTRPLGGSAGALTAITTGNAPDPNAAPASYCKWHQATTHNSADCHMFRQLSASRRKELAIEKRACFKCFKAHIAKKCS